MQYHVAPGAHPDTAALTLLSLVLSDTPGGRLHRALVDTHKAAWQTSRFEGMKDPGLIVFAAGTSKDRPLDAVRAALLAEVEGLATRPVTQEELDRARTAGAQRLRAGAEQSGAVRRAAVRGHRQG